MITTRTAALGRGFGKPVLAGMLVVLLSLSALASSNASLHRWLHQDHQSPTHYCLVTVLEHGQTEVASVAVPVVPAAMCLPVSVLPSESFFISHDLTLHPERGPPVLS